MSLTLALDTATDLASVAVGDARDIRAELTLGRRRHAAGLAPAIGELLRLGDARLEDVAHVLFADGPGSFTGLRIGVATVQGLLRARPAVAVGTAPSLMSAAWAGAAVVDGPIAALYDALRGEVYGAVYRFADGAVEVLLPPTVATVAQLAEVVPQVAAAVGDGAGRHAQAVRRWTGRAPLAGTAGLARASGLLQLTAIAGAVHPVADVTTFEPAYGRPAEAQARWERAHGRPLPHSPRRSG